MSDEVNRIKVISSHIDEIGYDAASKTLEILFAGGGVYQYFDVPEEVYLELIESDSIGKYMNTHIKGKYLYTRMPGEL